MLNFHSKDYQSFPNVHQAIHSLRNEKESVFREIDQTSFVSQIVIRKHSFYHNPERRGMWDVLQPP